jgi:prephenate dehydrogenase
MKDTSLSSTRIAIIGLGLMGGSLALALHGKCAGLLGADPDPQTIDLARRSGLCDKIATDPAIILPEADMVILATPVGEILKLVQQLPDLYPRPGVVMDIGSTKVEICQALAGLPERYDVIGGHPMCGREKLGLANAEAGLFSGAVFGLTPLKRTSSHARSLVEGLVVKIGARPLWLDPETHDRWVAATSHLPYLVSVALCLATSKEASSLVGPGFLSSSRLAATPHSMMLDVLLTNRENILIALNRFRSQLDTLEGVLVQTDPAKLSDVLTQGRARQIELTQNKSVKP